MLELERIGNEVYCKGIKLTIVTQASKGEGKEVVKIEGLEGSNGRKWISLSLLKEGFNTFDDLKAKNMNNKKYELTQEEQNRINELQEEIDAIIELAKSRYVPSKPKKVEEMDENELENYISKLEQILKSKQVI